MNGRARERIHIGTSGWSYEWWREVFYPKDLPKSKWLPYYANRFKTVEVNYSFYRLPASTVFSGWRKAVGEDFIFAVKASRYITHNKKLNDPGEAWRRFQDSAIGLGDKLGPILFEFPPSWPKHAERLSDFLELLPDDLRYAFEFRHPSWFDREVYSMLSKKKAALVIADSPRFPQVFKETADFSFIRFHGGRVLYGSDYSHEELSRWSERIADMAERGLTVFAYFNNDAFGFAPKNAAELKRLLGLEKAAAKAA